MKRAPKEMTDEEVKDHLMEIGVSTHKGTRKTKFSGFSAYAKEVTGRTQRRDYNVPQGVVSVDEMRAANNNVVNERMGVNPYAAANANGSSGNPYAQMGGGGSGNPYASMNAGNPYASVDQPNGNPYAQQSAPSQNPYAQEQPSRQSKPSRSERQPTAPGANPYAQTPGYSQGRSYGGDDHGRSSNGYTSQAPAGSARTAEAPNPYGGSAAYGSTGLPTQYESGDTDKARDELFGGARTRSVMGRSGMGVSAPPPAPSSGAAAADAAGLDYRRTVARRASLTTLDELNAAPDPGEPDEDADELLQMPSTLNHQMPQGADQYAQAFEGEMNSEDEDVEEIKREIRFTKNESVQSTRNTLQMAAEAEAAGRNTLGMLGSQGERVANTERTLALAESQTKIADEQSRELLRLQRSIFVPNMSNPFNSKRRMQEKEAKIKSEHLQEQIMRERRRQTAFESEQRVLNGLNQPMQSETALKYKREMARESEERRRMQFEADSEDEAVEDEIDANLEGISQAAGRLKNLSVSMNEEIDSQNRRLDRITDQTDNLDVDIHLSAARLTTIR